MSTLYKTYDGSGNLVVSTANFDLAWDVGMACALKDSGIPHLVIERPKKPIETLPFEAVPQPSRRLKLCSFFRWKRLCVYSFLCCPLGMFPF